jgi:hypothetical protein
MSMFAQVVFYEVSIHNLENLHTQFISEQMIKAFTQIHVLYIYGTIIILFLLIKPLYNNQMICCAECDWKVRW